MLGRYLQAKLHGAGEFDELLERCRLCFPAKAADAAFLQVVQSSLDLRIRAIARVAEHLHRDRVNQFGAEKGWRVPLGEGRNGSQKNLVLRTPCTTADGTELPGEWTGNWGGPQSDQFANLLEIGFSPLLGHVGELDPGGAAQPPGAVLGLRAEAVQEHA